MALRLRDWFRRPLFWAAAFIVLALLAWSGYFSWLVARNVKLLKLGENPAEEAQRTRFRASIAKTIKETQPTSDGLARIEPSGPEPTLGNPNAPVRIIEFVDYQCPYSKEVASALRDFMRRHAADAFFVLRDFPILDLHPDAEAVAIAARCVFEQGNADRFWRYHDRLYASQDAQAANELRLYAEQLGVDLASYDACVSGQKTLAHVRESFADGVAAGMAGTPTFFFNGVKIQGAPDPDSFEIIFQEAKKQAGA